MIIDILLPLSLIFIMFSLGIGLNINDFSNISKEPKAFFVGIFIQMLVLPIVAFAIALFLIRFARMPKRNVEIVSSKFSISDAAATINVVFALPPKDDLSKCVSFELRYGICRPLLELYLSFDAD